MGKTKRSATQLIKKLKVIKVTRKKVYIFWRILAKYVKLNKRGASPKMLIITELC